VPTLHTTKSTASKASTKGKKPHFTILPGLGLVDLDDPKCAGRPRRSCSDLAEASG